MAGDRSDILVQIKADTTALRRELDKVKGETARAARDMKSSWDGVQGAIKGFRSAVASLGGLLGGLAIGSLITSALRLGDQLQDTAAQMGITTDQLQALNFAAEETGLGMSQAQSAFDAFTRKVGDAASGSKEAVRQFEALGISIHDAEGNLRPIADLAAEAAQKITGIGNETQKASAASDLFGRAGVRMVPLLAELSGGWEKLTEKASAAGQVMSEETVNALADAQREIDKLKTKIIIAVGDIAAAINRLLQGPETLAELNEAIENLSTRPRLPNNAFTAPGNQMIDANLAALKQQRQAVLDALREGRESSGIPQQTETGSYDPEGDRSRTKATKEIKEQKDAVAELIYGLREEVELLQMSELQREQETAVRRAQALAIEQGRLLTLEEIAAIKEQIALMAQIRQGQDDAKKLQDELTDAVQKTDDAAEDMGNRLVGAFANAAAQGGSLLDILKAILSEIVSIMSQQGSDFLGGLLGDGLKGLGGLLGLGGGGGGGMTMGMDALQFGGFFADGGPVSPGKGYMVGEKGPEFFAPSTSGYIVPNAALRGGARGITIVQHLTVQTGVAQTVRAEIMGMMPRIKADTMAAVAEARQRGGSFSRALGN